MDLIAITESVISSSEIGPVGTSTTVILFGWGLLGGLLAFFWFSRALYLRRARDAAEAQGGAGRPLAPGDTVIAGRVLDDGEGPPVTVQIYQLGRQRSDRGTLYHSWTESYREVTARPFYIVRDSGERVRVEPDQRVFLVDKLDAFEPDVYGDEERRCRVARLTPDERVYVMGRVAYGVDPLKGSYREAGHGLVLHPPRRGRMLISTEPLADRHARAARHHRNFAIATLIALAFTHCIYFGVYHTLQLGGRRVEAPIMSTYSSREWIQGSSYWRYHYTVTVRDPKTGMILDGVSSESFYRAAKSGRVTTAPFLIGPGGFHQIGFVPTQGALSLWFFVLLSSTYAIVCIVLLANRRPWWERRLIKETIDGPLEQKSVALR